MEIRKYNLQSDFNSIFELNKLINPDEDEAIFRKDTENSKAIVLVAEENKSIVGFVSLSFPYWDRIAMTHHLVISPDYRGSGFGTKLIKAAIESAKRSGMKKLTLRTALWNSRATDLYKRCGFVPRAVFADYFGDRNDMVWMDINL